ncbi:MAG: SDR family oxidoreductase [Eggerthellaceae bacterium]|nr:SDR family oxidoreductase [Eggerthellaceae bacterium]
MARRVQVVTGGTSGMGLATAKALAQYGPVIIGGRNERRLADAVQALKDSGVDAHGARLDVADLDSVRAFAAEAEKIGPVGNVVHAAAVDMDNADTDTIIRINVIGTINVAETFYPLLEEGGSLANYSSVTGYYYRPSREEMGRWANPTSPDFFSIFKEGMEGFDAAAAGQPEEATAYFGSKSFVMFYTRANTARFGAKGCRVFSVAPGSFMTPMLEHQAANFASIKEGTAFKRFGDPDEMARLFAYLLDPKVAYLTGCDVLMDGGKFALSTTPQLA